MSAVFSRIWLNFRALGHGLYFATKENPRRTVFWTLILFFVVLLLFARNEAPVEKAEPQNSEADGLRTVRNKLNDRLCDIEFACTQFGIARQQCATAGNFDLCINVKMGDSIKDVGNCLPSGEMRARPSGMPSKLQCVAHRIDRGFR